jgi:GTP pyrophosphokinase
MADKPTNAGGVAASSFEAGRPISPWLQSLSPVFSAAEIEIVGDALEFALPLYAGKTHFTDEPLIQHIEGVASVLASSRVDVDTLTAGVLHALPDHLDEYEEKVLAAYGATVAHLVEGVARMGRIHSFGSKASGNSVESSVQVEALRKMLLAMAEDIRVVIIALADRVQTMRYVAATLSASGRAEIAQETMNIFAPLANRLGLWQMKWELEDFSFRIREPEQYKKIATLLEDTRRIREHYVSVVAHKLWDELHRAGIEAEVSGRPKHIYSIFKKMKRKSVDFKEINDASAVRILVNEIKDCYAALGVVHNLWIPIPKEFDDYIAKPKGNDYRSLHTTVIGPEDKVVEVQIRTYEMHRHSEMGVAAHWRYKEGAKRDARHEEKIAWLRQILAWKNDVDDTGELAEHFKTALFEDSVYVLTPRGKVVDLPKGSTPIDFAYHVHTDLGHRCRGAKVDDVMVPLDYTLQNAQRVEIISAKQGGPSRDWLNPARGYLKSHRARSKVRQWFSGQERDASLAQGRAMVEKELQRHGVTAMSLEKLAAEFKFPKLDTFLIAAARGEINARQLVEYLRGETLPGIPVKEVPINKKPPTESDGGIFVAGVDKLLTVLSRCCKPAPPDPIIGFVTRGRGITVHRASCMNLSRLSRESEARLINVEWDLSKAARYPVDIEIRAQDRQGLLHDISNILSREKIDIASVRTQSRDITVIMQFTLRIADLAQLRRVLTLIESVPGVMTAVRK